MKLLTKRLRERLLQNGIARLRLAAESRAVADFLPVVKLFTPDGAATWLLTETDPRNPDIAFGLCDLGLGSPELGRVSIAVPETVRGKLGLRVERDRSFAAAKPLSAYAEEAWRLGHIRA